MSALGPALPPHLLAKRKRQQEEEAAPAPAGTPGAKRSQSPADDGEKRRKVLGPAMPPAPLEERPTQAANSLQGPGHDRGEVDEIESSDDDIGPAPPTAGQIEAEGAGDSDEENGTGPAPPPQEEKLRRDDWMMMPPKQDDLAARLDPSKPRARGFNTGKGAKGPAANGGGDSNAWNETPEEKRKRLANEMMGISAGPDANAGSKTAEKAKAKKTQEIVEKNRGPSLMDQHTRSKPKDLDDDPSKRAFDREKDMGVGGISASQRKQMLNKFGDFNSRFSRGS